MLVVSKEEEKRGISTVYVPDPPLLHSVHEALSYMDLDVLPSLLTPGARRRQGWNVLE
jgi:hypothetical protein